MKLLENKIICVLIMLVLITGGFWLGGYKGLSGLYSDVESVFFTGEDGDGICIENDLTERVNAAENMVTIARKYNSGSDEVKALSDAAAQMSSLSQNKNIAARMDENKKLATAMSALYREMADYSLSERDERYRQSLYADFNSRGDTISHDPYNSHAQEYNEVLSAFPANIMAAVTPVEEAVIFY